MSDEEYHKFITTTGNTQEASMTLQEALRTPQLWMLGVIYGFSVSDLSVVQGQSTLMATTYGIPIALAGIAMTSLMIPAIISRIGIGLLGDRFGRKRMLTYSSILAAMVKLGGWLFVNDRTSLLLFMAILGLFMMAGISLGAPICGDMFGRKHIAAIWGIVFSVSALISGAMSLISGIIRTSTGSYNLVYLLLAAGYIVQVILLLLMKPTSVEKSNSKR